MSPITPVNSPSNLRINPTRSRETDLSRLPQRSEPPRRAPEQMAPEEVAAVAATALEELKGIEVRNLDVRGRCGFTDFMVFATGSSDRHVKSLAGLVEERLREQGERPLGVEGIEVGEWALLDYGVAVVHVMLQQARDFYQLERLWAPSLAPAADSQALAADEVRPAPG